MTFQLNQYADRDALAVGVAGLLAEQLRTMRPAKGVTSIALPGGSTPAPMLRALAAKDLSWLDINVTLTDERWVPVTSDRSNHALLNRTLFTGAAGASGFVPLYTGDAEPAQGMGKINSDLARLILPLDIAVLGMGADMHTASLFPGATGLANALSDTAPPAVAIAAPGAPEQRVTLTAPTLNAARRHILITGADKRAALDHAQNLGDPMLAPILAVLPGAIVHYAD